MRNTLGISECILYEIRNIQANFILHYLMFARFFESDAFSTLVRSQQSESIQGETKPDRNFVVELIFLCAYGI